MVLHLEKLSKSTPSSIKYLQQKLTIDGVDFEDFLKCKTIANFEYIGFSL
jgi:hypothetical protein